MLLHCDNIKQKQLYISGNGVFTGNIRKESIRILLKDPLWKVKGGKEEFHMCLYYIQDQNNIIFRVLSENIFCKL